MALTKITANIIEDGAISTASLANTSITADKLHTTLDLTGKSVTVATATAGDNDTTVASTAFVSTAIANLADSAPATLDTLNELAAALGDDANFSTTVTNSIALKAPLASPTFTGDATFDTSTLVIDSTNNRVGIGTTSPAAGLHVEGVTRTKYLRFQNLTDATSEVAGMYSSSGGGTNDLSIYASALSSTSSNIKFLTAPTNSATTTTLFLEGSSGNVGIGTNSPSAATPLTVYYSATSQFHVGGAQAGISNNVYYNGSAYTNRNTSAGGALLQLSTDGSFAMRRATSGSSPTLNYSMYIDGSGNVGIGTTSVDAKLHVEGATSGTNLLIDDGIGYGVYVSAQNSFNFSYGRNETSTGYINFRGYQDGNTQFRNLNIGNGKQGYIAFFDGVNKRVGIGTINPAAPLDVVSNSSAIGIDLRGRSSDNIGQLSFESNDSGTTYSQIQSRSTELLVKAVANIPMSFYTNNTERMRIDPSGVVIQRYYATDYYHLANSTFYEKRGGRVYGVGTFNLFTNGQSTTQSSGYVRVTAIYATPSGSAVWLYKISGNRTIHLIWSNTGGYSGSTPSVTWNSSILQVSNANSSVYYAVEVELINIGNTWSVSWGNFPGFI